MDKTALLIPVFLLVALLEWFLTKNKKTNLFSKESVLLNMCLGGMDQVFSIIHFFLFVFFLNFLYEHARIFTLPITWYHWVIAVVAGDFVSYWYHRFSHRINFLWAGHVTHHSSSYYNYSTGFRTSPFQGFNRIIFWGILPVLGINPQILFTTFIITGLYDFLLHTQNFPKVKWLEKIFVTPSLHKVHHGKNDIYIDKNYSSVFIIWDRLFGTFEDESETVTYGIKSAEYNDNDPVNAVFFHYKYLWKTAAKINSFKNKLKLLVMPPGWLPEDFNVDVTQSTPARLHIQQHFPLKQELIYAWLLFIPATVGIFLLMVFKPSIPRSSFILLAAFFIFNMVTATKIFNYKPLKFLKPSEWLKNSVFLIGFLSFYVFNPHIYLLIPALLAGINLVSSFYLPNSLGAKALQPKISAKNL